MTYKLKKDIVATYQNYNLDFVFSLDGNPKLYLTAPSLIVFENGLDNEKCDLVMYFNQVFYEQQWYLQVDSSEGIKMLEDCLFL